MPRDNYSVRPAVDTSEYDEHRQAKENRQNRRRFRDRENDHDHENYHGNLETDRHGFIKLDSSWDEFR